MVYDMLVIGGGPAGLTAAIYGCRAKMSVLVLEKLSLGGYIVVSDKVSNYPGFPQGITGAQLGELFEKQARNLGAELKAVSVSRFEDRGEEKVVLTGKEEFKGRTAVICSGTSHRALGIPGEEKFKGRGISVCATCDAPFFRNKKVLVVGAGNAALEEALFLTGFAEKVYLAHRKDRLGGDVALQEKVRQSEKIEILWNTVVQEVQGQDLVEGVTLANTRDGRVYDLEIHGVFVNIGVQPNTYLFEDTGIEMDDKGYILTDEDMETSLPGVFAAGDIRKKKVRQVVTAAADGAVAALSAKKYLDKKA